MFSYIWRTRTAINVPAYKNEFISFDQLDLDNLGKKDIFSRILSWAYFTRRKLLSKGLC